MDFSLNDIQQMMQDSASRFITNEYDFETRRKLADSDTGYDEKNWQTFAELGWLALMVPEEFGGLGGTIQDAIVLQEAFGKGMVVEPFFATVILSANLINKLGHSGQKETLLPQIAEGSLKVSLAHTELEAASTPASVATRAVKEGSGYVISGAKNYVLNANTSDLLLVTAQTSDDSESGLTVFVVPADSNGLSFKHYKGNDGSSASNLMLDQVFVDESAVLGQAGLAADAVNEVLADGIIALSAEAVGIMDALLEKTNEYVKTRKQFERPIGNFQVVQHRIADMFIEKEMSRSMLYFSVLEPANAAEAQRAASMLKVKIGNAARLVGQSAVQLHGGMGITDELDVGHYFKRLTSLNMLLGSRDWHLNRLIAQ